MAQQVILVLSAPTGGGKTTIGRRLVEGDGAVRFSISHTTRSIRPGERDGVDYHFVDRPAFQTMAARGEFFEWAEVHGHLYGTHRSEAETALRDGKDLLLDIDVQGGLQVKARRPDAVLVFLLPPSLEELLRRLGNRAGEPGFDLRRRLRTAEKELEKCDSYDYTIVNEDLDEAVEQVRCILEAARLRHGGRAGLAGELQRRITEWLRKNDVQG